MALLLVNAVSAQLIQFQKTYGDAGTDRCWSVEQTSDGGYIFAGETNSVGAGNFDGYLTKTDAYGAVEWTRTYGGAQYDWAYSVKQTSDGGYIVIGGTESSGNGLGDIWIFKTDPNGAISWQRTVGSAGGDSGNDIILTSDGGYMGVGFQNGGVITNDNACLVKMDASGNIQWIHTYSVGADDDYGYSVAQTNDGGYIMGGENYYSPGSAALVIKTDASGNVQWANTYGGSTDYWINSLYSLPSGDVVVAGASFQTSSYDAWLATLSSSGAIMWSNTYGAVGTGTDIGLWFTPTSDGGYAISGRSNSFSADFEAFLIKTDSTGAPEWSKRYGGTANEAANQVIESSNTGYVLAASSVSFGGGESAYLIKTDDNGVSGCNENIPSFLMSNVSTSISNVLVIDSALTNLAASSLGTASQTLSETPLCFTVGGQEIASTGEIIVYPNPAVSEFRIRNSELKIESVEIYNAMGARVFNQQQTVTGKLQTIIIDVSGWSSGVYFANIKTANGLLSKKIVKQ